MTEDQNLTGTSFVHVSHHPNSRVSLRVYGSPGRGCQPAAGHYVLYGHCFCSSQPQAGGKRSICWRTKLPFLKGLHGWGHGLTETSLSSTKANPNTCLWEGLSPVTGEAGVSFSKQL